MGEETETERRGRGVHVWRHSLAHAIVCLWRSKDTFRQMVGLAFPPCFRTGSLCYFVNLRNWPLSVQNLLSPLHFPAVLGFFLFVWVNMEVKEQLIGVGSVLPPCGAWASNSGPRAWLARTFTLRAISLSLIVYFLVSNLKLLPFCHLVKFFKKFFNLIQAGDLSGVFRWLLQFTGEREGITWYNPVDAHLESCVFSESFTQIQKRKLKFY